MAIVPRGTIFIKINKMIRKPRLNKPDASKKYNKKIKGSVRKDTIEKHKKEKTIYLHTIKLYEKQEYLKLKKKFKIDIEKVKAKREKVGKTTKRKYQITRKYKKRIEKIKVRENLKIERLSEHKKIFEKGSISFYKPFDYEQITNQMETMLEPVEVFAVSVIVEYSNYTYYSKVFTKKAFNKLIKKYSRHELIEMILDDAYKYVTNHLTIKTVHLKVWYYDKRKNNYHFKS